MKKKIFINFLLITFALSFCACTKKETIKKSINFKISALTPGLTINGGSFVNAISDSNTNLVKLDANQSAILSTGVYEFQSVNFEGLSPLLGKSYCGKLHSVKLSQANQNVAMNISEENCLEEPFITLISKIYNQNEIGVMITKWKTDTEGAVDPNQIALPLAFNGIYNFEVQWGDGQRDMITTWDDLDKIHNYAVPGDYTVTMIGKYDRIKFYGTATLDKILDVTQWGINKWETMESAFKACTRLQITAKDNPDLSKVRDMHFMFANATTFNSNISSWDTSTVTNMSSMFQAASSFNQNIGTWNTSNVTDMNYMFSFAKAFNQNIASWNTSAVKDMSGMFSEASIFNQNIGGWNTSAVKDMDSMFSVASAFNQNISNWNTSSVKNMSSMFHLATSFNQNIGNWNTAVVTDMSDMFSFASTFNSFIGGWNTSRVTDMSGMFKSAILFNQPIESWNILEVRNISSMFLDASAFNQDLSSWLISNSSDVRYYDNGADLWMTDNKPTF